MFVLRNVRTSPRSRIIAFVLSLLKKLERIDNSVTDRYSLIADLCGYAERFVFDLLRKAFLFCCFLCYIYFICRCLNDSDSPAQFVKSPIARRGN